MNAELYENGELERVAVRLAYVYEFELQVLVLLQVKDCSKNAYSFELEPMRMLQFLNFPGV